MDWKSFDWKSQKIGQIGEVLNKTVYRCGFCKGEGLLISKKTKCPVCLGKGTVKVTSPAVICAYCDGRGSSILNRSLACSVCKGKGVVSIETKEIEICSTCRGRGRKKGINLPCLGCKGKGVIPKTI